MSQTASDSAWFNGSQAELRFDEYDEYAEPSDRQPHETRVAWEDRLRLTGEPGLIAFANRRRELLKGATNETDQQ